MPLVSRLALSEAAKPVRREQTARANIDDGLLLLRGKGALRQRHNKNLIGAKRGVIAYTGIFDHVIAAAGCRVPKFAKALFYKRRHFLEGLWGFSTVGCKTGHRLQGVLPKGVDYHG